MNEERPYCLSSKEEQNLLQQQAKMTAMGEMIGNIAPVRFVSDAYNQHSIKVSVLGEEKLALSLTRMN